MNTFTPGPWLQSHRKGEDGMYRTEVYCSRGQTIANLTWYPRPKVDGVIGTYRDANARLIASAPDLLWALEQIVNDLPINRDWLDRNLESFAKGAIAKATGAE